MGRVLRRVQTLELPAVPKPNARTTGKRRNVSQLDVLRTPPPSLPFPLFATFPHSHRAAVSRILMPTQRAYAQ